MTTESFSVGRTSAKTFVSVVQWKVDLFGICCLRGRFPVNTKTDIMSQKFWPKVRTFFSLLDANQNGTIEPADARSKLTQVKWSLCGVYSIEMPYCCSIGYLISRVRYIHVHCAYTL